MSRLRAFCRALALVFLSLGSFFTLVLISPARRLASGWHLRVRNGVFRCWARSCVKVIGMRVRVTGQPPDGAFFLVSNHLGYVDIFLLASFVDAAFVAKADLRSWPVVGRVLASADTIFIDRTRKKDVLRVGRQIHDFLDRGLGIVLFPEATSTKGEEILRFKPPLLEHAVRERRAVHYACLSYRSPDGWPPAEKVICWWGDAPFLPHVLRLLRLPYLEATLEFGPEPLFEEHRKALADRLHTAMRERFTPVC